MNYELLEEATRYYKETPEGVEYMCKAFEEVRNESFNRGMQQGMQQGMNQKEVSNIRTLMESMNWSAQSAMDALKVPSDKRAEYLKLVQS